MSLFMLALVQILFHFLPSILIFFAAFTSDNFQHDLSAYCSICLPIAPLISMTFLWVHLYSTEMAATD